MAKDDSQGLSITVVVALAFALVSFLAWGILAASYTGGTSPQTLDSIADDSPPPTTRLGRPRASLSKNVILGVITFVATAFVQLPNLPAVISWHISNRLWLLILMGLLPLLVLVGGVLMKQVEQSLNHKPKVKRRKIVIPK